MPASDPSAACRQACPPGFCWEAEAQAVAIARPDLKLDPAHCDRHSRRSIRDQASSIVRQLLDALGDPNGCTR